MAELIRQYVPRRVAARAGQDDGSPESFERWLVPLLFITGFKWF